MKILSIFLLLLPFFAIGQKQLNLTRQSDGKIFTVADSKRVRIVTKSGDVYKGHIHFIDNSHLLIKKDTIAIADIDKLKTQPLLISIAGGYTLTTGAILLFTPLPVVAIPFIAGGILLPSARNNHRSNEWKYEISD
jgi:small nuclear ribonucleoprotein (snRNP)-like protein